MKLKQAYQWFSAQPTKFKRAVAGGLATVLGLSLVPWSAIADRSDEPFRLLSDGERDIVNYYDEPMLETTVRLLYDEDGEPTKQVEFEVDVNPLCYDLESQGFADYDEDGELKLDPEGMTFEFTSPGNDVELLSAKRILENGLPDVLSIETENLASNDHYRYRYLVTAESYGDVIANIEYGYYGRGPSGIFEYTEVAKTAVGVNIPKPDVKEDDDGDPNDFYKEEEPAPVPAPLRMPMMMLSAPKNSNGITADNAIDEVSGTQRFSARFEESLFVNIKAHGEGVYYIAVDGSRYEIKGYRGTRPVMQTDSNGYWFEIGDDTEYDFDIEFVGHKLSSTSDESATAYIKVGYGATADEAIAALKNKVTPDVDMTWSSSGDAEHISIELEWNVSDASKKYHQEFLSDKNGDIPLNWLIRVHTSTRNYNAGEIVVEIPYYIFGTSHSTSVSVPDYMPFSNTTVTRDGVKYLRLTNTAAIPSATNIVFAGRISGLKYLDIPDHYTGKLQATVTATTKHGVDVKTSREISMFVDTGVAPVTYTHVSAQQVWSQSDVTAYIQQRTGSDFSLYDVATGVTFDTNNKGYVLIESFADGEQSQSATATLAFSGSNGVKVLKVITEKVPNETVTLSGNTATITKYNSTVIDKTNDRLRRFFTLVEYSYGGMTASQGADVADIVYNTGNIKSVFTINCNNPTNPHGTEKVVDTTTGNDTSSSVTLRKVRRVSGNIYNYWKSARVERLHNFVADETVLPTAFSSTIEKTWSVGAKWLGFNALMKQGDKHSLILYDDIQYVAPTTAKSWNSTPLNSSEYAITKVQLNVFDLFDQNGRQIAHTGTIATVYGRTSDTASWQNLGTISAIDGYVTIPESSKILQVKMETAEFGPSDLTVNFWVTCKYYTGGSSRITQSSVVRNYANFIHMDRTSAGVDYTRMASTSAIVNHSALNTRNRALSEYTSKVGSRYVMTDYMEMQFFNLNEPYVRIYFASTNTATGGTPFLFLYLNVTLDSQYNSSSVVDDSYKSTVTSQTQAAIESMASVGDKVYVVLPNGIHLDKSASCNSRNYLLDETVNWENTGRDLLVYSVAAFLKKNTNNMSLYMDIPIKSSAYNGSGAPSNEEITAANIDNVAYAALYPTIFDTFYSGKTQGVKIRQTDNGASLYGQSAVRNNTSITNPTFSIFSDVNGNGSTSDQVTAAAMNVGAFPDVSSMSGISKQVFYNADYSSSTLSSAIKPGDTYYYDVTVRPQVSTTGIVIYDILEGAAGKEDATQFDTSTQWKGTFVKAEVLSSKSTSGVKLYYSTSSTLNNSNYPSKSESFSNWLSNSIWTQTKPSTGTVYAVAADFGSSVSYSSGDFATLRIYMKAPTNPPKGATFTVNRPAWDYRSASGDTNGAFNIGSPVAASLQKEITQITITKHFPEGASWSVQSGSDQRDVSDFTFLKNGRALTSAESTELMEMNTNLVGGINFYNDAGMTKTSNILVRMVTQSRGFLLDNNVISDVYFSDDPISVFALTLTSLVKGLPVTGTVNLPKYDKDGSLIKWDVLEVKWSNVGTPYKIIRDANNYTVWNGQTSSIIKLSYDDPSYTAVGGPDNARIIIQNKITGEEYFNHPVSYILHVTKLLGLPLNITPSDLLFYEEISGVRYELSSTPKELTSGIYGSWGFTVYDTYNDVPDDSPSKYSMAKYLFTVDNTYVPKTELTLNIRKTFNDSNNVDRLRPTEVQFEITNQITSEKKIVTVPIKADGTGTATIVLPANTGIDVTNYTVKEIAVNGYTASPASRVVSISKGNSKTETIEFTNTHTPETTSVTVSKQWVDRSNENNTRSASINFQVLANGTQVKTGTLNQSNGWSQTFTGLPKNQDGKPIVYTVKETNVPNGYIASYQGLTIVNTLMGTPQTINVTKEWDANANIDGMKPSEVHIRLVADGQVQNRKIILNEQNNWSGSFTNLIEYDATDLHKIVYTVKEEPVASFQTEIEKTSENNFTVKNTYVREYITVKAVKTWNDSNDDYKTRPESVTVYLLENGVRTGATAVLNEGNNWTHEFTDLRKYKDGKAVTYAIEEDLPESGYYVLSSNRGVWGQSGAVYTVNLVNSLDTNYKRSIPVEKTWIDDNDQDGARPESINITLVQDGVDLQTVQVTASTDWKHTFEVPIFSSTGSYHVYTLKEAPIQGYPDPIISIVQKLGDEGFKGSGSIINTHVPESIRVIGSKTWDDEEDKHSLRAESITIELFEDGVLKDTQIINDSTAWKFEFNNLPKYREGTLINYTIQEYTVDDYLPKLERHEVDLDTDSISGAVTVIEYSLTNTLAPGVTNVNVQKHWNDGNDRDQIRPEKVTVTLYADGVSTGDTLELNEENNWAGIVTGLTRFDSANQYHEIVYTVQEESIEGYTSEVTGEQKVGYTITNTHKPSTRDIYVDKTWLDDGDKNHLRPSKIMVDLYADGVLIDSKEMDDTWKVEFKDLFTFKEGVEVVYTVKEQPIEEYTSRVEIDATDESLYHLYNKLNDNPTITKEGHSKLKRGVMTTDWVINVEHRLPVWVKDHLDPNLIEYTLDGENWYNIWQSEYAEDSTFEIVSYSGKDSDGLYDYITTSGLISYAEFGVNTLTMQTNLTSPTLFDIPNAKVRIHNDVWVFPEEYRDPEEPLTPNPDDPDHPFGEDPNVPPADEDDAEDEVRVPEVPIIEKSESSIMRDGRFITDWIINIEHEIDVWITEDCPTDGIEYSLDGGETWHKLVGSRYDKDMSFVVMDYTATHGDMSNYRYITNGVSLPSFIPVGLDELHLITVLSAPRLFVEPNAMVRIVNTVKMYPDDYLDPEEPLVPDEENPENPFNVPDMPPIGQDEEDAGYDIENPEPSILKEESSTFDRQVFKTDWLIEVEHLMPVWIKENCFASAIEYKLSSDSEWHKLEGTPYAKDMTFEVTAYDAESNTELYKYITNGVGLPSYLPVGVDTLHMTTELRAPNLFNQGNAQVRVINTVELYPDYLRDPEVPLIPDEENPENPFGLDPNVPPIDEDTEDAEVLIPRRPRPSYPDDPPKKEDPPKEEPPKEQPPVEEPPKEEPPVVEPPKEEPPVVEPPKEDPPVYEEPPERPPYVPDGIPPEYWDLFDPDVPLSEKDLTDVPDWIRELLEDLFEPEVPLQKDPSVPKTGDDSNTPLLLIGALMSLIGVVLTITLKKKES